MSSAFTDITLYTPTPHQVGTPEYLEETSLENFVSDLYMRKMHGYRPPQTSGIMIQPANHGTWNRSQKDGSVVAIAPYYNYDAYAACDKRGKYKYILDLIQRATIPLSEEYGWDKSVFENAYHEVLACDFKFRIDYPDKQSPDGEKTGKLVVEKTETVTSVYASIEAGGVTILKKLFDKRNSWWYDSIYILAHFNKWLDTDRFGIVYRKGLIECCYSIERDEVMMQENGQPVKEVDFKKYFSFG